jgi:DNA-damage-inducible protein J
MLAISDTMVYTREQGDDLMSKTSSVYTRVEPEVKEQAEQVLSQLGIPMANAINLFLHQVILRKGIPFDVSLPKAPPLDFSALSAEQFNAEMEKGFASFEAGRTVSSAQVREAMREKYKS